MKNFTNHLDRKKSPKVFQGSRRKNNNNSASPNCSNKRTERNSLVVRSTPKEKPSVNSSFQQSLLKYEKHLEYFCKYINKIDKDEFTDLTDLLEKIKKLDFSLAEKTSQLRPLVQLLNRLEMLNEYASDQENSLVHAEEHQSIKMKFKRTSVNERDDWEIERTQCLQNILGSNSDIKKSCRVFQRSRSKNNNDSTSPNCSKERTEQNSHVN